MRGLNKKYSGATSLIVVLTVGMILIAIVGGIATLTIREQRQATNTDQSNRALQTAEAGVKLASQKLTQNINYTQGEVCGDAVPEEYKNLFPAGQQQQVTCISVTNEFSELEGVVEKDKATQIIIERQAGQLGPGSMQLRWHSDTADPVVPQIASYASPNNEFYPDDEGYSAAAAPEITFVRWTKGTINTSNLPTETVFFMPGHEDLGKNPDGSLNGVTSACEDANGVKPANAGAYRCVTNPASATGFNLNSALRLSPALSSGSFNYAIRIKPRYADMHFQLRIWDTSGNLMTVKSTNAIIDVTARSGNLYRRIKAEKPIIPTALESISDSVLFAGRGVDDQQNKNVCKTIVVKDDGTLAPAQDQPNCIP